MLLTSCHFGLINLSSCVSGFQAGIVSGSMRLLQDRRAPGICDRALMVMHNAFLDELGGSSGLGCLVYGNRVRGLAVRFVLFVNSKP